MSRKNAAGSSSSSSGAAGKKEKPLSVSAMLASMDGPGANAKPAKGAPKPKAKPSKSKALASAYGDIDLPSSSEEEDEEDVAAVIAKPKSVRATVDLNALAPSDKDSKKKDKREVMAAVAAEAAKREALRDDRDAFSVVIGARVPGSAGAAEPDAVDGNIRDIVLDNFSVSARGKELLKGASLRISHGRRYGLVGPNGMGKSTLLKLLAWRQVPVPKNIDVLLVEQEIVGDDRSATEAVVAANEELTALRAEQAKLEASNDPDDNDRLAEVYEKLNLCDSDAARARASKILAGLGFDQAMQARSTKSFSGGWRMRISLARALFMQPTLLLLDEPTNHLDLRAVLWLEQYLCSQWKKTLIVVSHDRDFLNTVCNDIIHLHDKSLHVYRGNFDDFESGYEQKRKEMNKKFEVYEKQMKAARKTGSKAAQDKVKGQALSKAHKEVAKGKGKGKGKNVANDDDNVKPADLPQKWLDYKVEFHFPEPTLLTPPLLQLIEVGFSYPGRPDFKLSDVDVGIDMGTRVAIVGPNGAGKSTLLNLLAGDLTPGEGEARRSQKLRIGRYSQHFVDLLTMEENAVQYLLRLHPDQEGMSKAEAVRAKLGKFGLPGHNHLTPIVKLSGGQKARVVFTSISMSHPHILLLDEPTNHLDMQSIDALADALDEFTGGVVLVSHDSRLISRVCEDEQKSQIWVVEDGTVEKYDGSFEDYKDELMAEIKKEVEE
ncbi:ABC transporter F family member 4 [Lolium perenne]|uniref:ABC transporter F family member 4 n=1 Tax=Lolium perenne TaxID=4522 RepID=UPI0021EB41BF|nr:ABC transporter F family member 4 [Lolium perenne]